MGQAIDIFRLSGMKYPIHILTPTFSTVSLATVPHNTVVCVISGRIKKRALRKIDDLRFFDFSRKEH